MLKVTSSTRFRVNLSRCRSRFACSLAALDTDLLGLMSLMFPFRLTLRVWTGASLLLASLLYMASVTLTASLLALLWFIHHWTAFVPRSLEPWQFPLHLAAAVLITLGTLCLLAVLLLSMVRALRLLLLTRRLLLPLRRLTFGFASLRSTSRAVWRSGLIGLAAFSLLLLNWLLALPTIKAALSLLLIWTTW